MKPGNITHTIAVLLSSITSLFAHRRGHQSGADENRSCQQKIGQRDRRTIRLSASIRWRSRQITWIGASAKPGERYPWKQQIVTTVFWIGEKPSENNPVPNRSSSWDKNWSKSYGGFDDPNPAHRSRLCSGKIHAATKSILLRAALQRQSRQWPSTRSVASRSVVQRSLSRPGAFRFAKIDGSRFAKATNRLRAMGRRRTVSHRSLAIRFRQRTAETESEQGRRARCFAGRARLPRLEETDVTDWQFVDFRKCRAVRGRSWGRTTPSSLTIAKPGHVWPQSRKRSGPDVQFHANNRTTQSTFSGRMRPVEEICVAYDKSEEKSPPATTRKQKQKRCRARTIRRRPSSPFPGRPLLLKLKLQHSD